MTLQLAPIGLRAANTYVREVHRHNDPVRGHKFSVAVVDNENTLRGVAIAGRPRARKLDDGTRLECLRVATDGSANACSMLYGAVRRAALAMGYRRENVITYTLLSEPGTSLRAAGWIEDEHETRDESWHRDTRPREDIAPEGRKRRWHA